MLYQPEIPPNTGNIIRLCANAGAVLHLIGPLGFDLDDRRLRRAGLDYRECAAVHSYESLPAFLTEIQPNRLLAFSTGAERLYTDAAYRADDALLFGPETRGLPQSIKETVLPSHLLRIPMVAGSRSLNLSNAVAIVVYEAWRQQGFSGASRFSQMIGCGEE